MLKLTSKSSDCFQHVLNFPTANNCYLSCDKTIMSPFSFPWQVWQLLCVLISLCIFSRLLFLYRPLIILIRRHKTESPRPRVHFLSDRPCTPHLDISILSLSCSERSSSLLPTCGRALARTAPNQRGLIFTSFLMSETWSH